MENEPIPEGTRHRQVAQVVANLMGDPQLGEDINSGRMEADFIMPLLGGMLDQATRRIFLPTVGGEFSGFNPEVRPMVGTVTLLDGSQIKITLEAQ